MAQRYLLSCVLCCAQGLTGLSEILAIHLTEGQQNFPESLDVSPYTDMQQPNTPVYSLQAVVVRIASKGDRDSGHFIAFIRKGALWFCCDDSNVTVISSDEVHAQSAFMLFYRRGPLGIPEVQRAVQIDDVTGGAAAVSTLAEVCEELGIWDTGMIFWAASSVLF